MGRRVSAQTMRRCDLRDVFGRPREGFHRARIGDAALWDLVATLAGAYAAHRASRVPLVASIVLCLVGGEVAHWYACVDTATLRWLRSKNRTHIAA